MPTVSREAGFRFAIHFDDHAPAHVHVWRGGYVARIAIGDIDRSPQVLDPGIMPPQLLRRAVRIVEANQESFLAAWIRIHGS